ncbi:MAG: hypothetical protein ACI8RZ_007412 [Myxococcota bacterium]
MSRILLRVGLPSTTGALPGEAERLGVATLISANSLWDHDRGHFRRPGDAIYDLDVALDSAGFVAMCHYGGFPWPMSAYVELAYSHSWAWWSQPDLCCEPEIAPDRATVLARVDKSAELLAECRTIAADLRWRMLSELSLQYERHEWLAGAEARHRAEYPDPMPVLQGRLPEDYLRSADAVADVLGGDWPALVGVGSVCRRNIHGAEGLLTVLAALHDHLPDGVKLHLFGVKGGSIPYLLPIASRIGSIDSMAWDFDARWKGDSSMGGRKAAMRRWVGRQQGRLDDLAGAALLARVLTLVRQQLPTGMAENDLDRFMRRNRAALEAMCREVA